jgi:hypothetical protein
LPICATLVLRGGVPAMFLSTVFEPGALNLMPPSVRDKNFTTTQPTQQTQQTQQTLIPCIRILHPPPGLHQGAVEVGYGKGERQGICVGAQGEAAGLEIHFQAGGFAGKAGEDLVDFSLGHLASMPQLNMFWRKMRAKLSAITR